MPSRNLCSCLGSLIRCGKRDTIARGDSSPESSARSPGSLSGRSRTRSRPDWVVNSWAEKEKSEEAEKEKERANKHHRWNRRTDSVGSRIRGDSLVGEIFADMAVRIIFLDVDGVLTHLTSSDDAEQDHGLICSDCVKKLKRILDQTLAKIVLSSTWRLNPNLKKSLFRYLRAHGVEQGMVVGETPDLTTEDANKNRTHEIKHWLFNPKQYKRGRQEIQPAQILNWVSLDDMDLKSIEDEDALKPHHIKIDPSQGICKHPTLELDVVQKLAQDAHQKYRNKRNLSVSNNPKETLAQLYAKATPLSLPIPSSSKPVTPSDTSGELVLSGGKWTEVSPSSELREMKFPPGTGQVPLPNWTTLESTPLYIDEDKIQTPRRVGKRGLRIDVVGTTTEIQNMIETHSAAGPKTPVVISLEGSPNISPSPSRTPVLLKMKDVQSFSPQGTHPPPSIELQPPREPYYHQSSQECALDQFWDARQQQGKSNALETLAQEDYNIKVRPSYITQMSTSVSQSLVEMIEADLPYYLSENLRGLDERPIIHRTSPSRACSTSTLRSLEVIAFK